jgi:hypothetical protein
MQENAAPPRVGRDLLVAHERGVLARMKHVTSKAVVSLVEGDHVAIHWIFEMTDLAGTMHKFDEVALQEWRDEIQGSEKLARIRGPSTATFRARYVEHDGALPSLAAITP